MKKLKTALAVLLVLAIYFPAAAVSPEPPGLSVPPDISQLDTEKLGRMIAELESLVALCSEKGMNCPYESVNIAVLKKYAVLLEQDKAAGYAEQLEFTVNSLNRLYFSAKGSLESFLAGEAQPQQAPRYLNGARTARGPAIFAQTAWGERPCYFVGYGHFGQAAADIPILNSLGANIIQNEIGPNSVIVPLGQGSHNGLNEGDLFDIDTSAITNRIIPMLRRAAANNVCVSLLISPHYFPAFLYAYYPDLAFPESGSFLQYHINHPVARRVIEVYLRTLIPMIKDCEALFDICLSNEPVYTSSKSAYDFPAWQEYLAGRFGSVEALNAEIGTSYRSFSDAKMPAEGERNALAVVWTDFNNALLSGWHAWMAGIIKEYTCVPVDSKVMSYLSYAETSSWRGTQYSEFAEFCDFNGNDSWANLNNTHSNLYFKNGWYDYIGDMHNVPTFNSEDHIIGDRSALYGERENELLTSFVGADMWQGAIHGRDASTIWVWERSFDDASDFNGSILHRPECIASVGRTALDLNRLALEVNAFDNTKEEVAILFSDNARTLDMMSPNFILLAVQAAACAGKSVRYVTEDTIAGLEDGMLLVVPNAMSVKRATLDAVNRYALAGNEVLLMNRCMDLDETGRPQDAALLKSVYRNCTVFGFNPVGNIIGALAAALKPVFSFLTKADSGKFGGLYTLLTLSRNVSGLLFVPPLLPMTVASLRDKMLEMSPNDVLFVNPLSGTVLNTEWRTAEYNGRLLVNVCNYSSVPIGGVSLVYQGKRLTRLEELITQKTLAGPFTLEPYEPMLFSIELN